MVTCYGCGGEGHIEANCPNTAFDTAGKPYRDGTPRTPWCGFCDERTRLVHGHLTVRCQQCHPFRHQNLKQFRRCPACHATVYEWDNAPCGDHVSPFAADRRPEREHIDAVIASVT